MENLLDSLFQMPSTVANDWQALAQAEGSHDPCLYANTKEIQTLFKTECEDKGFGKCFFAPGINCFFRGDVPNLEGEKTLIRAYRSASTNRVVFVKIDMPTAVVAKDFADLLSKIETKKKVEKEAPSL